jgi:hypothetical protein
MDVLRLHVYRPETGREHLVWWEQVNTVLRLLVFDTSPYCPNYLWEHEVIIVLQIEQRSEYAKTMNGRNEYNLNKAVRGGRFCTGNEPGKEV